MKLHIEGVIDGYYSFVLNPIRGKAEDGEIVGQFDTEEKALACYMRELTEPYEENGHVKSFKKGGPFEMYKPLKESEFEEQGVFGHGLVMIFDSHSLRDIKFLRKLE